MIYALYFSGYLFFLYTILGLERGRPRTERLLLISVALIPIGKLFYLPVQSLMGFKFCFVFACIALLLLAIRSFCRSVPLDTAVLFPLLFLVPALISLPFLHDVRMLFKYSLGEGQVDSVLARLISLAVLVMYASWVASFVAHATDGFKSIAAVYSNALLFTCLIGYVIFALVFLGRLHVEDLLPISADTHLVGDIYRFNPGANVDEFGTLLGYGIMLVLWLDWSILRKMLYLGPFFVAVLLTLNRTCWIGVPLGLLIYIFGARRKFVATAGVGVLLGAAVFLLTRNHEISDILLSRTVLDIGASGADRLGKYSSAYSDLTSSPWRLLFGFGWSSNLYVHSVPIQLLYETGLVGVGCYLFIGLLGLTNYRLTPPSSEKSLLIPLMAMMFVFGSVQHTLYHMQTWLIIGLFWGVVVRGRSVGKLGTSLAWSHGC
jgi:hypothetical protein